MNVIKRMQSPTPKFFRTLRNVSLVLAGVSASIMALPASIPGLVLPAVAIKIASHLAIAGVVAGGVSQTVIEPDPTE